MVIIGARKKMQGKKCEEKKEKENFPGPAGQPPPKSHLCEFNFFLFHLLVLVDNGGPPKVYPKITIGFNQKFNLGLKEGYIWLY